MELGQMLHANPVGIETSDFVDALIFAIQKQLTRVYWNVNQKIWGGDPSVQCGEHEELSYEPLPPGIEWRDYYNWCGSPDDPDWNQSIADAPNLSFEGVEIRWYKHIGRSMNVNVCWPAEKWQRWFERIMQTIRAYEQQSIGWNHGNNIETYPDKTGMVSLDPSPEDLRYMKLLGKIDSLGSQLNVIACICIDVSEGKPPRDKNSDPFCKTIDWVFRLGNHALSVPGKLKLHD